MVLQTTIDIGLLDEFPSDRFERITRRSNLAMPCNKARAARRAAARNPTSRRAARHVSGRDGGVHRRRRRMLY